MKKNNGKQLELPILSEVSSGKFHANTKNGQQSAKLSACFNDDVKAADADDIKIYHSISNAYFRALSTQKR
ncbi:TPA: hypothetical protein NO539_004307 [Klebsiella pneumoniae]|uniref:hypothetical protein n=1 Tax=Klebsiella pneumoniae TaxID=573 RepID=UPI00224370CC|nr:hypothetical protein [Klebsiella pneumoniae]MCW8294032.1 hypothetical protein [Klebsiella pneumoniae]HCI4291538.1 hypothetical protein [Klebsiella pneumoniae]